MRPIIANGSRASTDIKHPKLDTFRPAQVGFSSPFQADGVGPAGVFPAAIYPGATQIFSAFLAEPRTYGVTLRGKF